MTGGAGGSLAHGRMGQSVLSHLFVAQFGTGEHASSMWADPSVAGPAGFLPSLTFQVARSCLALAPVSWFCKQLAVLDQRACIPVAPQIEANGERDGRKTSWQFRAIGFSFWTMKPLACHPFRGGGGFLRV